MKNILRTHLSCYPAMQIQDVYKLLHQAAFGSGHAITDTERARKWLAQEIAEMGAGAEEMVFEPISPDGEIVRVHLRPFLVQGGNPEVLLSAFIRTANEFIGDKATFERYWIFATELMKFPKQEGDAFIAPLREKDYPAVHHSTLYRDAYHPAYRVVLKRLLDV